MADSAIPARRAIILTALPVEYQAVCRHLANPHEETHPSGTVYEHGTFSSSGRTWEVLIAEIGAGGTKAAVETTLALDYFKPNLILFIGVAGGLKDVKLGDVVAATKVYGYESGKADIRFLPRPEVGQSTHRMEQRARAEARRSDWLQRIEPESIASSPPGVFVAPIAAGEKVLASKRAALAKFLQSNYSDAVAVEMEGHGFFQAVHTNSQVDALIIRGISDLIDNKAEMDALNWQEIAARHASAFAFEILAKLAAAELPPSSEQTVKRESPTAGVKPVNTQLVKEDTDTIEIFYSYAPRDEKLARQLQNQLILLERRNVITDWYAGKITGGQEKSLHMDHLNAADIILLLISPDYVASEHYEEAQRAMERYAAQETRVIPIILRPTDGWQDEPFGKLQAIPRGDKPIVSWGNTDAAFAEVAREIRAVVEQLKENKKQK